MVKTFTLGDVKTHTTEKDCWLVIHGKVYNVTEFLDEHPGGYDIVVSNSGAHPLVWLRRSMQVRLWVCVPAARLPAAPAAAAAAPSTHRPRALADLLLAVHPGVQARTPQTTSMRLATAGRPLRCWRSITLATLRWVGWSVPGAAPGCSWGRGRIV